VQALSQHYSEADNHRHKRPNLAPGVMKERVATLLQRDISDFDMAKIFSGFPDMSDCAGGVAALLDQLPSCWHPFVPSLQGH